MPRPAIGARRAEVRVGVAPELQIRVDTAAPDGIWSGPDAAATARAGFLPLAWRPFLARQESRPSPSCAALRDVRLRRRSLARPFRSPSRLRSARPATSRSKTMANIGTFTKTSDGAYAGVIHTLTMNLKAVQFRPTEKTEGKGPDFLVMAGAAELGAAWAKTSEDGRAYLSVKLDDPSLDREIYAKLFDGDDGYDLVWYRPAPKEKAKAKAKPN
jgi:uncharacterized protein (DUF736 family)